MQEKILFSLAILTVLMVVFDFVPLSFSGSQKVKPERIKTEGKREEKRRSTQSSKKQAEDPPTREKVEVVELVV